MGREDLRRSTANSKFEIPDPASKPDEKMRNGKQGK
jgi:hypothetical protein